MNTTSNAIKLPAITAAEEFWIRRIVRQLWQAHLTRRAERAGLAQLSTMSDRELRDIGLSRADITFAVKGHVAR